MRVRPRRDLRVLDERRIQRQKFLRCGADHRRRDVRDHRLEAVHSSQGLCAEADHAEAEANAYAHVVGLVVRRVVGGLAYAAGVAGTSNPDESVTRKSSAPAKRKPSLDLTAVELDPGQTSDDTDAAWGEGQPSTDDVRRYLDEKPPHHGD